MKGCHLCPQGPGTQQGCWSCRRRGSHVQLSRTPPCMETQSWAVTGTFPWPPHSEEIGKWCGAPGPPPASTPKSLSHFLKLQPPKGSWTTSWALGCWVQGAEGSSGSLGACMGDSVRCCQDGGVGSLLQGALNWAGCPVPALRTVLEADPGWCGQWWLQPRQRAHTGHWAQPALDTWGSCLWVGSGADPEQGSLSVDREATSPGPGDLTKR